MFCVRLRFHFQYLRFSVNICLPTTFSDNPSAHSAQNTHTRTHTNPSLPDLSVSIIPTVVLVDQTFVCQQKGKDATNKLSHSSTREHSNKQPRFPAATHTLQSRSCRAFQQRDILAAPLGHRTFSGQSNLQSLVQTTRCCTLQPVSIPKTVVLVQTTRCRTRQPHIIPTNGCPCRHTTAAAFQPALSAYHSLPHSSNQSNKPPSLLMHAS